MKKMKMRSSLLTLRKVRMSPLKVTSLMTTTMMSTQAARQAMRNCQKKGSLGKNLTDKQRKKIKEQLLEDKLRTSHCPQLHLVATITREDQDMVEVVTEDMAADEDHT